MARDSAKIKVSRSPEEGIFQASEAVANAAVIVQISPEKFHLILHRFIQPYSN
jgi:hypothetical protein